MASYRLFAAVLHASILFSIGGPAAVIVPEIGPRSHW
jgi:hypothetical protein